MAKVFISFLGTNPYIECNYYVENEPDRKISNVKFVQEATIKLHAPDFDKYIFLLTNDARKKNWLSHHDCHPPKIGLAQRLTDIPCKSEQIIDLYIPDCVNTQELWEVFNTIYNQINNDDELVIDVTHGFRMLPMLSIVVVNYLKVLKAAKVIGIYYGAIEMLGNPRELNEKPLAERNAPLLNLISFSAIQDWSHAAQNLVKYGITLPIKQLMLSELKPILIQSTGSDPSAVYLRNLINTLSQVYQMISAVRGRELYKPERLFSGSADEKEALNQAILPAIVPLKEYLMEHVNMIVKIEDPVERIFKAVDLCVEYEWWQEGFTLLRENIINYILHELEMTDEKYLYDINFREYVSEVLNVKANKVTHCDWSRRVTDRYLLTLQILNLPVLEKLATKYFELISYRNDMNHGGFNTSAMAVNTLKQGLQRLQSNIKAIIAERKLLNDEIDEEQQYPDSDASSEQISEVLHLVNFSNHPYKEWSEVQKQSANRMWAKVIDLPFPQIDPNSSVAELKELADDCEKRIINLFPNDKQPRTVHIMGEQTFCFLMINKLQKAKIYCIASTTERDVSECNGVKQSTFHFKNFRKYPDI